MEILNKTSLGNNCPTRDLKSIYMAIVHRIDNGSDATSIAQFFKDNTEWTGGKMPYHFIISNSGVIEQSISLNRVGYAALRANPFGIQIACIGDFRNVPPFDSQKNSLFELLLVLNNWFGKVNTWGHTEIKGASKDTTKDCPGKMMLMSTIRSKLLLNLKPYDKLTKNVILESKGVILNG